MPIPQGSPNSIGTLSYPLTQPILGNPGPYKSGVNLFVISTEVSTSGATQSLVAYQSTDGGTTYPTRIASGIRVVASSTACVFFDNTTNPVIGYCDAVDNKLKAVSFNLSTGLFGTPNSSGVTPNSSGLSIGTLWIINSGTSIFLAWDDNTGLQLLYYNGASWSAVTTIGSAGTQMLPMTAVAAANHAGVWSCNPAMRGNAGAGSIFFTYMNGAAVVSTSTALTLPNGDNRVETRFQYSGYFDSVSNSSVLALPMFKHSTFLDFHALLIASPTAVPVFSLVTVISFTDSNDFTGWPFLTGNAAGTSFTLFWYRQRDPDNEQLVEFSTASSLTGPWSPSTAPGTLYYDQNLHPPTPTPLFDGIFPLSANTLSDGSIGLVVGMTQTGIMPAPTTWCGILYSWAPVGGVSQTLQLNKIVSGGPSLPSAWTLTGQGGSPLVTVSGPGPQVGPTPVPATLFHLSEDSGPTWNSLHVQWNNYHQTWNGPTGNYTKSNWVCTGGGSMPDGQSVIIPPGANIICTIVNTFVPPTPVQPGNPCSGTVANPATDTQFELRRVYASMKPAPRVPVRGGTG